MVRTILAAAVLWTAVVAAQAATPAPKAAAPTAAAPVASTDPLVLGSAECLAATVAAEKTYGAPPNLLATIARVESGRPVQGKLQPWPWAIDADGRAYYFDTKEQAIAGARAALAGGSRALDIGCMQVDLQQHPGAFKSLDAAFDPATNVDYGARYLKALYTGDAHGSWPLAVGMYHSHTPDLAEEYRGRVAAEGTEVLAGVAGPQSLFQRAIRQGTLRLALAGGGTLVLNIGRQPVGRRQPRLSRCQVASILGTYLRSAPPGCRLPRQLTPTDDWGPIP